MSRMVHLWCRSAQVHVCNHFTGVVGARHTSAHGEGRELRANPEIRL